MALSDLWHHTHCIPSMGHISDEGTGEEEYYDGKIDAAFVDGGVAHYHVVYDDGDEEEVYKDEAFGFF